jgi:ELWxxDGT repeat protein
VNPARGPRRAALRRGLEPLEERTLLSLSIVTDINAQSAFPQQLTPVGASLFYTTSDNAGGEDLTVTNGSGTTVLHDFAPTADAYGSGVRNLKAVGTTLFFTADGGDGRELWASDGTPAGTREVKDINPGANGSDPFALTAVGSLVYFEANPTRTASVSGQYQLWVSDGTTAGTKAVDLGATRPADGAFDLESFGGKLAFLNNGKLYLTDGTAAGTTTLHDFSAGGTVSNLRSAGSLLFMVGRDAANGRELWKSDGTPAGTTLVKDINPGTADSDPSQLTKVGTRVFFAANDGTHGIEPWVSDGTAAGTTLVQDINVGTANSSPSNFNAVGTRAFFVATDGHGTTSSGRELWTSDGTTAGTTKLKDLVNNGGGYYGYGLSAGSGGNLFFAESDTAHGQELWKSDGTVAGTVLVKDINPGAASSFPTSLADVNGTLFFGANDGTGGNQLWSSNGTAAGTVKIHTFTPGATEGSVFANSSFVKLGSIVLFAANDAEHGRELWRTDGTDLATSLVKDLAPGPDSSSPSNLVVAGTSAFFTTSIRSGTTTTAGIWITDGTATGTTLLKSFASTPAIYPSPSHLTPVGSKVFFTIDDGTHGEELWVTDGTAAGTQLTADINPGAPSSYPHDLVAFNGKLYFAASEPTKGEEFYVSDGTAAGTTLLKDINPGATGSNPTGLTVFGGKIYFGATDGAVGAELWASDGTAAGTGLVKNVGGAAGASVVAVDAAGPTLFFFVREGAAVKLGKSDGTAAGTVQVADLGPAGLNINPSTYTATGMDNGILVFSASDAAHGTEPWRSDGTAAGTTLLKDINPGATSGLTGYGEHQFRKIGSLLYFAANDGVHGSELWQTDGTTAGTVLTQDINPGKGSSNPAAWLMLNGKLLGVGNDGVHGTELLIDGGGHIPPVIVSTVVPDIVKGKFKDFVITFSAAVDATSAQNLANYQLFIKTKVRTRKGKPQKFKIKNFKLLSVTYNATTHQVTLVPKGKVKSNATYQLAITGLTDTFGRPIDGDHNGTAGGDFQATIAKGKVTILAVVKFSQPSQSHAATDHAIAALVHGR